MKGFDAIGAITSSLSDELIISANGFLSRQLYTLKDSAKNFYMLGSMGLASSIGMGLSLSVSNRRIVIIDGDGNILMNLGSLATIGHFGPKNLVHMVLDNECYDSTGGQPTVSNTAKLEDIAKAAGYKVTRRVADMESLRAVVAEIPGMEGPVFVLVKTERGKEKTSRVLLTPSEIARRFASELWSDTSK